MSDAIAASDIEVVNEPPSRLWGKILRNPLGLLSIILLLIFIAIAIVAPWIRPYDPDAGSLSLINLPPSAEHLLGTDSSGRDILSRLVTGIRSTYLAALVGTSVAVVVGVLAGLLAGYYGRWVDAAFSWVTSVTMAIPTIIALIALFSVIGPSPILSMVVFGVLVSPALFRLVRGLVNGVKVEMFIDAAKVSGLTDARIIARHIFFAVRAPVIIQAAFIAGSTITVQSALDFLGLGDANVASIGTMLQEAFANLYIAGWQLIWPGVALALSVSSLVIFGNSLRDALQGPRTSAPSRRARRTRERAVAVAPARPGPHALLEVEGLRLGYPTGPDGAIEDVVRGVDLAIDRGEVVGLVGESGSGKSQTAFSILGLLPTQARISAGSIRFDGKELLSLSDAEMKKVRGRGIAYIPQEPMSNLDPSYRIGQQLVFGLRATTTQSKHEAKKTALALLSRVGIRDPQRTFNSYPHEISGGMAQRVLIAGSIACEPTLLIADEPTTALDVTVQAEILELLRSLQRERGMGVLLVTHNFGVVADLCDRVVVMKAGMLVESGDTESVFSHPQHPYTRELLDAILSEENVRPELQGEPV